MVSYSDTVDFRGLELDVTDLHETKCSACGHNWKSDGDARHNMAVVKAEYARQRDLIRARNGMLSSADIAAVRQQLHLTQREASEIFGGGPNSFNKYESGEVLQSQSMDKLLRVAAALGPLALELMKRQIAPTISFAQAPQTQAFDTLNYQYTASGQVLTTTPSAQFYATTRAGSHGI